MRRWWLLIALLLSLGVNVGLLSTAALLHLRAPGRGAGERERPPRVRVERFAGRLGLDGEKRSRFVERQEGFLDTSAALRQRLARTHRELRREIAAPHPDRERIARLLDESARTFRELESALADHVLATRSLLDPGQERRFLDSVERRRGPFSPRRPAGGPGRRF